MKLKIDGEWFIDENNRKILLRGVNFGGSSKVPYKPDGDTHIKTDFSDHKEVSFVGRPFPLKDAEEHFTRIKYWGFNCVRFVITWEAIEHKGPEIFDEEYLDYLEELFKIAEKYEIFIFIDPHQDAWSRMSGGDGAPGWTFEKVGIDFSKFDVTEAAYVMQYKYDPENPKSYPPLYWSQNSYRFASATMWTLFFGGVDFAPSCKIEGKSAQEYFQDHFLKAIKKVAERAKNYPNVIGFNTINEPPSGWIGLKVDGSNINFSESMGYAFTPIDAMLTASGFPRTVGLREVKRFGIKETRKDELNKDGITVWLEGVEDIWKKEGIWELNEEKSPVILNNDHFINKNGNAVDFYRDYLSPFIVKYAESIRSIIPEAFIFFEGPAEPILKGEEINFKFPDHLINLVNAAHWYDVATIGMKTAMIKASFDMMTNSPVIGNKNIQKMFIRQLSTIKDYAKRFHSGIPTLLGEFGLPYDLDKKKAFETFKTESDNAWEKHEKALNMYYNAIDENMLNSTQWNYTADNTNKLGDKWNLEDLSIFSIDQRTDPGDVNSGGRAIRGFCRPHFIKCAGTPQKMEFDMSEGIFDFEFNGDISITAPTIIYVPKIQYPKGFTTEIINGEVEIKENEQILMIYVKENGLCKIRVSLIK